MWRWRWRWRFHQQNRHPVSSLSSSPSSERARLFQLAMEPEEISVVLSRASELHLKLADAIALVSRSSLPSHSPSSISSPSSFAFHSSSSSSIPSSESCIQNGYHTGASELQSLVSVRDALHVLEQQLESLQVFPLKFHSVFLKVLECRMSDVIHISPFLLLLFIYIYISVFENLTFTPETCRFLSSSFLYFLLLFLKCLLLR